jgi:hypothetical protein
LSSQVVQRLWDRMEIQINQVLDADPGLRQDKVGVDRSNLVVFGRAWPTLLPACRGDASPASESQETEKTKLDGGGRGRLIYRGARSQP